MAVRILRHPIIMSADFHLDSKYNSGTLRLELFSIRATFQTSTDLLVEASIPEPEPGGTKTSANVFYGSLIVDVYF